MKIVVHNLSNKKVGEVELPEAVFDYPYNEHLIYLAVEACRAAQRRGTHKVKGRSEVTGSGRKLWRQKGTGRARVGAVSSPIRRGGGVTHGPQLRSHEKGMSAGEKRNALKSALSRRLQLEGLLVLDKFELKSHKTAELAAKLEKLGVTGKALLVDRHDNQNLTLAARNNPLLKTVDAMAVNVYDVVDRAHVVMSQEALDRLMGVLSK